MKGGCVKGRLELFRKFIHFGELRLRLGCCYWYCTIVIWFNCVHYKFSQKKRLIQQYDWHWNPVNVSDQVAAAIEVWKCGSNVMAALLIICTFARFYSSRSLLGPGWTVASYVNRRQAWRRRPLDPRNKTVRLHLQIFHINNYFQLSTCRLQRNLTRLALLCKTHTFAVNRPGGVSTKVHHDSAALRH